MYEYLSYDIELRKLLIHIGITPNYRGYNYIVFALDIEREKLYEKINKRVDIMIEQGLIQEVEKLLQLNNDSFLPIVYVIENGKIIDQVDYPVHDNSAINDDARERLENEYLDLLSLYL